MPRDSGRDMFARFRHESVIQKTQGYNLGHHKALAHALESNCALEIALRLPLPESPLVLSTLAALPQISIGTAALLIFGVCLTYILLRGVGRMMVGTAMLTASALLGLIECSNALVNDRQANRGV